jgi:phospholipase C
MPAGNGLSSVRRVVVLMLENRSFDHMLGFLQPTTECLLSVRPS